MITYDATGITVQATKGGHVALLAEVFVRSVVQQVQTDLDGDGIVRFPIPLGDNIFHAVAVDVEQGTYAFHSRYTSPTTIGLGPGQIVRGTGGMWSQLELSDSLSEIFLIRPGGGVWGGTSAQDEDGARNGWFFVKTTELTAYMDAPPPAGVQRGDLLVAIGNSQADRRGLFYRVAATVDAVLDAVPQAGTLTLAGNPIGDPTKTVTVIRVQGSEGTVSVRFRTTAGSAIAGTDYEPVDTVVHFAPGEVLKRVHVVTTPPTAYAGPSSLSFGVELLDPVGTTFYQFATRALGVSIPGIPPRPLVVLGNVPPQVPEKDGPWTLEIPLSLQGATRVPATISYAINDQAPVQVSFPVGQTSASIPLTIAGNTIPDEDKLYRIRLQNPIDCSAGPVSELTIRAVNEELPDLTPYDRTVSEAGYDVTDVVRLSATTSLPATFSWKTVDGTALAGKDYFAASGTQHDSIRILLVNDGVAEPAETFYIEFSNVVNARLVQQRAAITILDPVAILEDAVDVREGAKGTVTNVPVKITLSQPAPAPFEISLSVTPNRGSATGGTDYRFQPATITIPAGQTEHTVFAEIVGDSDDERDEWFEVFASSPAASRFGHIRVNILDDEFSTLAKMSVSDTSVTEATDSWTTATFAVTLTEPVPEIIFVAYATTDITATAGADYVAKSGTIWFAPGETSATVSVLIVGDALPEPDERFRLTLSDPFGGTLVRSVAEATIRDNDGNVTPALSISPPGPVRESTGTNTNAVFNVTMNVSSSQETRVSYATADMTATAGSDYSRTTGTLVFAPGEASKTVVVPVLGDSDVEDDERFAVVLSAPSGAPLAVDRAEATILDDDLPQIAGADTGTYESAGAITVMLNVTPVSNRAVTVQYATADGTAVAGSDYQARSGTLTLGSAGQILIPIVIDNVREPVETFYVDLTNPANATLREQRIAISIVDDTPQGQLSVADVSVDEKTGSDAVANFEVMLAQPMTTEVRVSYATSNLTALAGADYATKSGQLVFAPGETRKTVPVTIFGDGIAESDERFRLTLSSPVNATIARDVAEATIHDDDNLAPPPPPPPPPPARRRAARH
ncbi:MAG TPA: Calx-beta domain-containing protein [Thermoanaerobaculia bacterium]|nr:Calx-beta domain-containing protein [Thermoanaerobaculia bacterium]